MVFPLFPGIPGGPELLIILLVFLIVVVGPGILLVLLGIRLLGGDEDERIEELEARIDELEAERETGRSNGGATADGDDRD